ncbi:hypothetical protein K7432_013102 [Basidiobolus ranarum]|uniref:Kaptin n=1 Tax=Basidiobolus ranarum TaxID=34480 RepID=A0ABR2WJU3_9FUNG
MYPLLSTDAKINLLVACAVEYACIYEAIDTYGLTKSCSLEKCGDFDSVLCVHVGDVDFDGQQEIVLGTYGQQLLVYKYDVRLIDRLAFKLVWKRAFAYPIYHIGDIDLDLDGLNELLVTSMYGVHILKVDLLKSRDRLRSVIKYLRERKKIEHETQQPTIQSQENEDPAKSDELTASLEDLSVEENHLEASKEASVQELSLSDASSLNSHASSKEDPSPNDLET